jgi:hypothetical protein
VVLNTLYFTFPAANVAPIADAYRHILLYVEPFYSDSPTLGMLWSNHHPRPLHAILTIFNALIFSLDYRFETVIGLFCLFSLSCLILYNVFRDYGVHDKKSPLKLLQFTFLFAAVISALYSLNPTSSYMWTLVTVGFLDCLVAIFIYCVYSNLFRGQTGREGVFYIASFILLFINFNKAVIFLAPVIFCAAFFIIINYLRPVNLRVFVLTLALILLVKIFLVWITPDVEANPYAFTLATKLHSFFMSPGETIDFYGFALISGLVKFKYYIAWSGKDSILNYFITYLSLAVYIFSFFLYVKNKLWYKSVLPLLLALMPIFFLAALFIGRYDFNAVFNISYPSSAGRYAFNYKLGWIGVVWIYYLSSRCVARDLLKPLFFLPIFALIFVSVLSNSLSWDSYQPLASKSSQRILSALHASEEGVSKLTRGHIRCMDTVKVCDKSLEFLRLNSLSIFAASYAETFSRVCQYDVSEYRFLGKKGVGFMFPVDLNTLPVDIRVNDRRVYAVKSISGEKRIDLTDVGLDRMDQVYRVDFYCYKNNRFQIFDSIDFPGN